METAKMSKGLVMLSLIVTAFILCSHRPAMAEEAAGKFDSQLLQYGPWDASCRKFMSCVKNPSSSCITECCDSFNFWAPLPQKCNCWRTARQANREALYVLHNYCRFNQPTVCPHLQVLFSAFGSSHHMISLLYDALTLPIDRRNEAEARG